MRATRSFTPVLYIIAATVWLSPLAAHAQAAVKPWEPGTYPAHCAPAARRYDALPGIDIDPDYESPKEVVLNYRKLVDAETGEEVPGLANAINSFGGMLGYAQALESAYDEAAREYWAHFDRIGQSDPALEKEYAYWKWRRGRFSAEVAGLQGVAYQSGSGAARFLADTLGGTFSVPSGVLDIDDSRDLDYVRYSECTLEHAETVDEAIEYQVLLDQLPANAELVQVRIEEMRIDALSDDDKRMLASIMRERREASMNYDGTPHSGLSGSAELVREALADARAGDAVSLSAFIDFLELGAQSIESGKHSWRLAVPTHPGGSGFGSVDEEQYDRLAAATLYLYGIHPTRDPSQIATEYFPDGYAQAGRCAIEKLPDAARYMYSELGPVMERAAEEQSYNKEFCVEPIRRLRAGKHPLIPWQAQNYACMAHDAWRLSMIACASGKAIGADADIARTVLSKYPSQ